MSTSKPAILALEDGSIFRGRAFGSSATVSGECVFNTSMTGYHEILTDPSYAGEIITFTFPHIGNVGANAEDVEGKVESAVGCVVREDITAPANFRAEQTFNEWMEE